MVLGLVFSGALVFAVNLLPAYGPPTSAILVAFRLNYDVPATGLIAVGAVAAASSRFVLANGARHFRPRLSEEDGLAATQPNTLFADQGVFVP